MSERMDASDVEMLPWSDVESSNVARVAWVKVEHADGPEAGTLYVEFRGTSGRIYAYENVREEQHAELVAAESIGGYLNAEIKPAHDCERIEVVPPGPPTPPKPASHRPVG